MIVEKICSGDSVKLAFNLFYHHHICLPVTFIYVAEMLLISANTYLTSQGRLTCLAGVETRLDWRGLSKTESETSLTQANRLLYPYQKQNTTMIARINIVVDARIQWCLQAVQGMPS